MALNFSPEVTGAAPYTSLMAKAISESHFQVDVVTAHPHYPSWRRFDGYEGWSSDETFGSVNVRRLKHYIPAKPFGLRRALSEISFGIRLVLSPWKKYSARIVVTPALLACALVALRSRFSNKRSPLIIWVQDIYTLGLQETQTGGKFAHFLFEKLESWTLKQADAVICIHPRFSELLVKKFQVNPSRVHEVRNWSQNESEQKSNLWQNRKLFNWSEDDFLVLHTGNLGVKQGLENVVHAASEAALLDSRIKFVLIGDGVMRESLEELAYGLKNMLFLPQLDSDLFQKALACANALLVNEKPGVAEMSLPSKLTTYFAAGRPILAAVGLYGITSEEVRHSKAGLIVESGDAKALADAAWVLLNDSNRANEMGDLARLYAREYLGTEPAVKNFLKVLNKVSSR
jgi:glycosyltransferase involved in cell wall biosynthesis